MTTPPADWYDDPEDPSQYRYWDGTSWTDHRSPKRLPPAPGAGSGGSAWNIFPVAFNAVGATWRNLVVLSVPQAVVTLLAFGVGYQIIDEIFEGNVSEVIDRFGDGVVTDADERFIESIDPQFPSTWLPIGIVVLLVAGIVSAVVTAAMHQTMAASLRGRDLDVAGSLRNGMSRLGRIIGWPLLVALVMAVAFVPAVFAPPLLALYVLAAIPLTIWLWPFFVAWGSALSLAPAGRSPFTQARNTVAGRWGFAAVRCLVLTLFGLCIGFGTGIVGQIFAFDPAVYVVGVALLQIVQNTLTIAGNVAWWHELDGELAPEITQAPVSTG